MQILTLEDRMFSLNNLPDEVDENTRFAVLDNSNPAEPDFFFMPLIFLESFNAPAMILRIGNDEITMPIDWSIAVGDSSSGEKNSFSRLRHIIFGAYFTERLIR